MSMIAFHSILEDSESNPVTSFHITGGYQGLLEGTYTLIPYYCDVANCDCREVWVEIIQTEKSDDGLTKIVGDSLAFIDYGWDSPEFYAKRKKTSTGNTDFPGVYLDIDNSPSEHAETLLELFISAILENEDFRCRLEEQYYDFKFRIKEMTKNDPPLIVSLPPDFQPASFLPSFRKKRMKLR